MLAMLSTAAQAQSSPSSMVKGDPTVRLQDIYKSYFQDWYGPGHLLTDTAAAHRYLQKELQETPCRSDTYYEYCGGEGNFVRVDLAVIKDGIVGEDQFFKVFSESVPMAKTFDKKAWQKQWKAILGQLEKGGAMPADYDADKAMIAQHMKDGKFVMHHSKAYGSTHKPHYRIIHRSLFDTQLLPMINKATDYSLAAIKERNEQQDMLIRISEIDVYSEYLNEYLKFALRVVESSVREEPGVVAIFPMVEKRDSCKIRIVEIYANQEAYKHHITTPHFQTYKQGTLHMVKHLDLVDMDALNPDAMGAIFRKMNLK